jgi:hypothetical protein
LQGLSNDFYSSYKELLESAEKGCMQTFRSEFEALSLETDYLNTLASGITIQMMLCSSMPVEAFRQDLLVISVRNNVRLELELSINRSY